MRNVVSAPTLPLTPSISLHFSHSLSLTHSPGRVYRAYGFTRCHPYLAIPIHCHSSPPHWLSDNQNMVYGPWDTVTLRARIRSYHIPHVSTNEYSFVCTSSILYFAPQSALHFINLCCLLLSCIATLWFVHQGTSRTFIIPSRFTTSFPSPSNFFYLFILPSPPYSSPLSPTPAFPFLFTL